MIVTLLSLGRDYHDLLPSCVRGGDKIWTGEHHDVMQLAPPHRRPTSPRRSPHGDWRSGKICTDVHSTSTCRPDRLSLTWTPLQVDRLPRGQFSCCKSLLQSGVRNIFLFWSTRQLIMSSGVLVRIVPGYPHGGNIRWILGLRASHCTLSFSCLTELCVHTTLVGICLGGYIMVLIVIHSLPGMDGWIIRVTCRIHPYPNI